MKENEKAISDVQKRKEKIRNRYKGVDQDEITVIPAIETEDFYNHNSMKRVAVYARVSTDDPNQTSSYELQKNHYKDVIKNRDDWELVDIYADEGISGTSLQHRDEFLRMIEDCKAGLIDLIVTKSVSRFARNIMDSIGYIRMLKDMNPPIGIFFETENIYSLDNNSEMALSFMSTLAQEESHNKSEIMNASIDMRFKRGIFLTPPLLGYDNDEDGNLIINEEEAKTVRLIFFMYLYGYTTQAIADTLESLGRRTKKGRTKWSSGAIISVLKNERHCGDVLARKTYTPNYLNHKSKVNKNNRTQYIHPNHHEAIISRDDFIAVQRLISNAKYGNRNILPELHIMDKGLLKGFISINPNWAGFKKETYMSAYRSVFPKDPSPAKAEAEIEASSGEFDLRGYQVVRGQFFSSEIIPTINLSINKMHFGMGSIKKFQDSNYVEILIEPQRKIFAVRPVSKENKNAIKWSSVIENGVQPKTISATACMPAVFDVLGWDPKCKYRITGSIHSDANGSILLFNVADSEILIPGEYVDNTDFESYIGATRTNLHGFPASWANDFGTNYYYHAQSEEISKMKRKDQKLLDIGKTIPLETAIKVKTTSELEKCIDNVLNEIRKEAIDE